MMQPVEDSQQNVNIDMEYHEHSVNTMGLSPKDFSYLRAMSI